MVTTVAGLLCSDGALYNHTVKKMASFFALPEKSYGCDCLYSPGIGKLQLNSIEFHGMANQVPHFSYI